MSLVVDDCWETAADRRALIAFLHDHQGERVWSIRSPLTLNITVDLSPLAAQQGDLFAQSLRATAWDIQEFATEQIDAQIPAGEESQN